MKKFKFVLPFALLGMVLTGCNNAGSLPLDITDADREITTEWKDYVVPAGSVSFKDEEQSLTIKKGDSHTYNPQISPKDASPASLTWVSNDEAVATINENGVLTAVGGGQTTISVLSNDEQIAELEVNVYVPIESMSIDVDNINLDYNQEYNVLDHISFVPADTTQTELTYTVSKEGVFAIEDGVIQTGESPDSAVLTIANANLESTLTLNVVVSDHTNYAASIAINGNHEVEITKSVALSAEVTAVDTTKPITHEGVTWSVVNKDGSEEPYASISEEGLLEGLKAGVATVTATSVDGKVSQTKDVTVFEVAATSLNLNVSEIDLTNTNKTYQIVPTFTTDRVGFDEPSVNDLVYSSDNPEIASVNANGFVTALLPGTTTIRANSARYNLHENASVVVVFTATAVMLTGKTTAVVGEKVSITATVNPVEASVDSYSFHVEGSATTNQLGNVLEVTPTDSGNVNIIATESRSGVSSNPFTIKVSEPSFENGYYLVGSSTFAGGTSIADSADSWVTARRALKFEFNKDITMIDEQSGEPVVIGHEYKAAIKFNDNDSWLIRTAGDDNEASTWKKPTNNNGEYTQTTPFTDGSLRIDYASGNVIVDQGGKFEIYFKQYTNSDWFEVYVKHADFIIEPSSLKITISGEPVETTLKMSYWVGENKPNVTSSAPDIVEVLSVADDGTIAIRAKAAGSAVITALDGGNAMSSFITVISGSSAGVFKSVYLNTNGEFDVDNVTMYAHSWDSSNTANHTETKIIDKALKSDLSEQEIVYTVDIPEDHNYVLFTRGPADATEFSWDTIYEQSENIALSDEIDMWTMTGREMIDEQQRITGFVGTYNPDHDYKVVINSGFGLKFANGDEYVGVADGQDYQGRDQYKIEDVEFKKDVEFSIYDFKNQASWIEPLEESSNPNVSIVNEKYVASKDFTADVYLKIAYENNSIYIGEEKSGGGEDPENNFDADKFYVVGSTTFADGVAVADSDASWNDSTKAVLMTLNNDGIDTNIVENQYKATVTFNAGDEWRVRSKAYPVNCLVENAGAFAQNPAQMTYASFDVADANSTVAIAGKYDIYFKILKAGGYSIYVSPKIEEGGGDPDPDPATIEYTISWEQDWVYNDNNVVLCWAWGGSEAGEGKWYATVKVSNTSLKVTLPSDVTNFKFARFDQGTTTSTASWNTPPKNNESSEITVNVSTSYQISW